MAAKTPNENGDSQNQLLVAILKSTTGQINFQGVGNELSISTSAAQKRVKRYFDKLSPDNPLLSGSSLGSPGGGSAPATPVRSRAGGESSTKPPKTPRALKTPKAEKATGKRKAIEMEDSDVASENEDIGDADSDVQIVFDGNSAKNSHPSKGASGNDAVKNSDGAKTDAAPKPKDTKSADAPKKGAKKPIKKDAAATSPDAKRQKKEVVKQPEAKKDKVQAPTPKKSKLEIVVPKLNPKVTKDSKAGKKGSKKDESSDEEEESSECGDAKKDGDHNDEDDNNDNGTAEGDGHAGSGSGGAEGGNDDVDRNSKDTSEDKSKDKSRDKKADKAGNKADCRAGESVDEDTIKVVGTNFDGSFDDVGDTLTAKGQTSSFEPQVQVVAIRARHGKDDVSLGEIADGATSLENCDQARGDGNNENAKNQISGQIDDMTGNTGVNDVEDMLAVGQENIEEAEGANDEDLVEVEEDSDENTEEVEEDEDEDMEEISEDEDEDMEEVSEDEDEDMDRDDDEESITESGSKSGSESGSSPSDSIDADSPATDDDESSEPPKRRKGRKGRKRARSDDAYFKSEEFKKWVDEAVEWYIEQAPVDANGNKWFIF